MAGQHGGWHHARGSLHARVCTVWARRSGPHCTRHHSCASAAPLSCHPGQPDCNLSHRKLTSRRRSGTCQTPPGQPPSCGSMESSKGVLKFKSAWRSRLVRLPGERRPAGLVAPAGGVPAPAAAAAVHASAGPGQAVGWARSPRPPPHLHHRSPRVRKQATEWRARWCIQPCCRSCAMMASILKRKK